VAQRRNRSVDVAGEERGNKQLAAFSLYFGLNIILLPLVFVAIGLVGRLLDRSFRLENDAAGWNGLD
jgi:uncharacterized membrane protein YhdT